MWLSQGNEGFVATALGVWEVLWERGHVLDSQ